MSEYKNQARDTNRAAEEFLLARYREMAPWKKVNLLRELSRASQELALAGIRLRHPGASDHELRMRLASTRLPPAIMRQVFDWRG